MDATQRVCGGEGPGGDAYRTVMLNGFTDGTLAESDGGMVYGSLRAAASVRGREVTDYFNTATAGEGEVEPLAGLNTVFVQDGMYLHVPDGVKLDYPVVVDCRYASDEEALACFARMLMIFGAGSSAEVVVLHRSTGDGAGFLVNAVSEVFVGGGADVRITEFSCMNPRSTLLHGGFVSQQGDGRLSLVSVASGGEATRIYYDAGLKGSHAELDLHALWLAGGAERKDFYVRVNHSAPDCKSRELVKGIASGDGVGSFTGRVYVARDAQRTEALQQSRNIEMNAGARIYTRPQLEIYADDVKCSHGATVGQLDDQAVFYMRQRGIDPQTARRMQLEGFVHDVTSRAGFAREFIDELIQSRISVL